MRTSLWYGWILVFLTNNCNQFICQRRNDKKVFTNIRTIERFVEKINIDSLQDAFQNISNVLFYELHSFNEMDLSESMENDLSVEVVENSSIVIVNSFYSNIDGIPPYSLVLYNTSFELRVVSMTDNNYQNNKWDGEVFARHGKNHSKWWYQGRKNHMRCQLDDGPSSMNMKNNVSYTLLYVKENIFNIEEAKKEFLKYLGGNCHVKCEEHDFNLVTSFTFSNVCINCGKKEYMRCPNIECKICLCRECYESCDEEYVTSFKKNNVSESSSISESDIDDVFSESSSIFECN